MQKMFIKCVIRMRVSRFLHSSKKIIRRFQKDGSSHTGKIAKFYGWKTRIDLSMNCNFCFILSNFSLYLLLFLELKPYST
jgi:hypothetical protein